MYMQLALQYRARHEKIPSWLRIKLIDIGVWDLLQRVKRVEIGEIRRVYTGRYVTLQLILYDAEDEIIATMNLFNHGFQVIEANRTTNKFLFRKKRKNKKKS